MTVFIRILALLIIAANSYAQVNPTLNDNTSASDAAVANSTPAQATPELEETSQGDTEINVRNADILSLVKIFSKKTKRNYILDERVKGTVSIYLPGKISADEAVHILDSVLSLKGFTTVPIGENIWKIIPAVEAKQTTIPTVKTSDDTGTPSAAIVTRFINLKYVNADDVKQLLAPLISSSGLVNAYTGTNSLIIIDSEENIFRLMEIIAGIDIPFTDRDMSIIPIEHADAKDVADKIKEILLEKSDSNKEAGVDQSLAKASLRQNQGAQNAANIKPAEISAGSDSMTVSARSREPKIIADERTNSVIIIADDDTSAKIKALVTQLDSPIDKSGERFYVYRCQHANAEDLAEVLNGLAGNGGSSDSSKKTAKDVKNENTRDRLGSQQRTPGRQRNDGTQSAGNGDLFGTGGSSTSTNTTSDSGGGITNVKFSDNLSISADPSTNSLIISGSRQDYEKIKGLLDQLDIKRRQVLVEAVILEVSVQKNDESSVSFLSSIGGADGGVIAGNDIADVINTLSNPASLSKFTVAAASAGSLKLPGGTTLPTQTIIVDALSRNDNVNILSAPTIVATDNEEAEIVVGQNVPFLASTASNSQNLNNVFNQIDRQDVGITLRLTPQISSSDFVTMKLFTEVSAVLDSTAQSNLGPTTTIRTSQTTVISKDGQMVVIGGLISDAVQDSESGIPFLQDIPFLGAAFRSSINKNEQRNLLIFITPRVIRDQFDARDNTIARSAESADMINHYDMSPDREGVLKSKDIDNVAESEQFNGDLPGTILPPVKNDQIEKKPSKTTSLSVKPKLPHDLGSASSSARFLVFKLDKESKDLPFNIQADKTIAIQIPEDSNSSALNFFEIGRSYKYSTGSGTVKASLLGKFTSTAEAAGVFPLSEKSWYTLSPYEILNLGKSPWSKN